MMLLYKKLIRVLMIFIMVFTVNLVVHAQDPNGPDPGPDPAPIDGGLGILLAAGVGYGVKKYREKKKQKSLHDDEQVDNR